LGTRGAPKRSASATVYRDGAAPPALPQNLATLSLSAPHSEKSRAKRGENRAQALSCSDGSRRPRRARARRPSVTLAAEAAQARFRPPRRDLAGRAGQGLRRLRGPALGEARAAGAGAGEAGRVGGVWPGRDRSGGGGEGRGGAERAGVVGRAQPDWRRVGLRQIIFCSRIWHICSCCHLDIINCGFCT
ncbi:unnamed protein product, partial [Urochloa humidicola]